jgi:hypothetical protein
MNGFAASRSCRTFWSSLSSSLSKAGAEFNCILLSAVIDYAIGSIHRRDLQGAIPAKAYLQFRHPSDRRRH